MNPGSVLGLLGLIVVGVIIADLVASPGTPALISGINSIFGTTVSGLLGKAPAAPAAPVNRRK